MASLLSRTRTAPRLAKRLLAQAPACTRTFSPAARPACSLAKPFVPAHTPIAPHTLLRCYSSGGDEVIVKVPSMGDSITEGTLGKWHKKVGDVVAEDDLVANIETDKIEQEIRSPKAGVITKLLCEEQDTVKVGSGLFAVGPAGAAAAAAPAAAESTPSKAAEAPKKDAKPSSSRAPPAHMAKGAAPPPPPPPPPSGKVGNAPPAAAPAQAAAAAPAAPSGGKAAGSAAPAPREGGSTRVPMSRMRRRIAERLKDSQNTLAMLTTFQECDMSALMHLRNKYKDEFLKRHGVKLGFMSAFVKASAIALRENPIINATIDGDDIVYNDFVDISVAVATPKGLVVPVVRDCDKMSFADIEKEIGRLGAAARDGKLAIEDMNGGTFTISNGGVYGSMMGTPIVNPPQSAILGMHAIVDRPMAVDGKVEIRPMMYLALTYDHRLIDGRDAVTFLRKIRAVIESPERIVLDL